MDMGLFEKQFAVQLVVLFVKSAAGDEDCDFHFH
jgi:hypothetical protein